MQYVLGVINNVGIEKVKIAFEEAQDNPPARRIHFTSKILKELKGGVKRKSEVRHIGDMLNK